MWDLSSCEISDGHRFTVHRNGDIMSHREYFVSLKDDADFQSFFITSLQQLSYEAFRWETPGYTEATLDQGFEFVVLNDSSINRTADSKPFESYISGESEAVVSFQNLGKDAHLVVPSCLNNEANYCHLASFTKTAPFCQQQKFWSIVGQLGIELASSSPVWLSTAGDGVAWLHVRFDTRPKYYHYNEFKKSPNK